MGKDKWEDVADDTFRLTVPGGWLYRWATYGGMTLAFVPHASPAPAPPPFRVDPRRRYGTLGPTS